MDVPHGVLSELANVDTICETSKVDVVIIGATHNELFILVSGLEFNHLNTIDNFLVHLYEPSLNDVL